MENNALTKLVRSEAVVIQELMAGILEPMLGLTDAGDILPNSRFSALDPEGQTLALLVAVKALETLGIRQKPSAGPTELARIGGIPAGTVKPIVRDLVKRGLISSKDGQYWLTVSQLNQVALEMGAKEGSNGN